MRRKLGVAFACFMAILMTATAAWAMTPVFQGDLYEHPYDTSWFEADISVPTVIHDAPGEWASGWIMANTDQNDYVQIGWQSDDTETDLFVEHREGINSKWQRTIFTSDLYLPGDVINVAISNDEGTNVWHYWLGDQMVYTSTATFGESGAYYSRQVELHDANGLYPKVGEDHFTNSGWVVQGVWEPLPDLTTKQT